MTPVIVFLSDLGATTGVVFLVILYLLYLRNSLGTKYASELERHYR
jgi:hypothetical protein